MRAGIASICLRACGCRGVHGDADLSGMCARRVPRWPARVHTGYRCGGVAEREHVGGCQDYDIKFCSLGPDDPECSGCVACTDKNCIKPVIHVSKSAPLPPPSTHSHASHPSVYPFILSSTHPSFHPSLCVLSSPRSAFLLWWVGWGGVLCSLPLSRPLSLLSLPLSPSLAVPPSHSLTLSRTLTLTRTLQAGGPEAHGRAYASRLVPERLQLQLHPGPLRRGTTHTPRLPMLSGTVVEYVVLSATRSELTVGSVVQMSRTNRH